MSRPVFALVVLLVIVVVFTAMWLSWRARARRDAQVQGAQIAPSGEMLASFPHVLYVSTTPEGEPLTRVAAPGLRYRGWAQIDVRADGVTVSVTGEEPVHLTVDQLRGSGSARVRVGKAVERDGLSLLRWASDGRVLESSFRFDDAAQHQEFTAAIDAVCGTGGGSDVTHTTQEDAR